MKNTVSTLVLYMKRFLPENCFSLLKKPPEPYVEIRRPWVKDLRRISLHTRDRIMDFIQDYHATVKNQALRMSVVLKKAKTFAVRKYLREIPVHRFPPLLVDDKIS